MSGLTILFVILAVVLTVPVYAFAVRRLLGLRLSPVRAWIGGLIALACASPIITAIGSSIAKHNGSWSLLPAVWFVILGVAIALLIGMPRSTVLVSPRQPDRQADSPQSTIPATPSSCSTETRTSPSTVTFSYSRADTLTAMILASDRGLSMCGRGCTITTDWSGDDQGDLYGDCLA